MTVDHGVILNSGEYEIIILAHNQQEKNINTSQLQDFDRETDILAWRILKEKEGILRFANSQS